MPPLADGPPPQIWVPPKPAIIRLATADILRHGSDPAQGVLPFSPSVLSAAAKGGETGNDANTLLLLHCDGSDGSTTFTDVSAGGSSHTVTAAGNAQVDTAQSKFGGASALFDGTADRLNVTPETTFDLGTMDFTFDFWVRFSSVANFQGLLGKRNDDGKWGSFVFHTSNQALRFRGGTSNATVDISGGSVAVNTWYHIAVVRDGTNFDLYIDGISVASDTGNSNSFANVNDPLTIGATAEDGTQSLDGWIDEFRFSNVARWTANFSPPTAPYGPDA